MGTTKKNNNYDMNTKKKKKKSLLELLFEKNICFAVCAISNHCINKRIEGCSRDYAIIINQSDTELLESDYTFHPTDKYEQIFEQKLSPRDIEVLKKYKDKFVMVIQNKYGRVYELKGNSFKESFDNNNGGNERGLSYVIKTKRYSYELCFYTGMPCIVLVQNTSPVSKKYQNIFKAVNADLPLLNIL